jgi:hypothetical protein
MKPSKESPHYESWLNDFQPPAPLIAVSESEYRLDRAQILLELMKEDFWPNSKLYMRGEDLVAILMVAREKLENDGPLSGDDNSDFPKITSATATLVTIAKSCKHCKNTTVSLELRLANDPSRYAPS